MCTSQRSPTLAAACWTLSLLEKMLLAKPCTWFSLRKVCTYTCHHDKVSCVEADLISVLYFICFLSQENPYSKPNKLCLYSIASTVPGDFGDYNTVSTNRGTFDPLTELLMSLVLYVRVWNMYDMVVGSLVYLESINCLTLKTWEGGGRCSKCSCTLIPGRNSSVFSQHEWRDYILQGWYTEQQAAACNDLLLLIQSILLVITPC